MLVGFAILGSLGAMFSFAGASAVFGREGVVIDMKARTVSTWWNILWFRRSTSYNLGTFTDIVIERRRRGGVFGSHRVYSVDLRGQLESVEIVAFSGHTGSKKAAREIAEFLGMNWTDAAEKSGSTAR